LPYILSLLSYRLPLIKIANSSLYVDDRKVRAKNYVPPGIDLDIFHPKTSDPAKFKGENKIIIGCIGRKETPKGIVYLLDAYHQLGTKFHLKAAYGNLPDISKNIDVTIDKPSNDIELANFYRSIDLLIAPGIVQHGSYHYPVMESIACGTPVLHTGYLPGSDLNSWQCESRSALSIKNKIEEFVKTDSHIIREKVNIGLADISKLSWHHVSKRFIRLINEN
jgi:glycosyltransferase involved in cell wall biosynthesis